jgi:hypothetical protein
MRVVTAGLQLGYSLGYKAGYELGCGTPRYYFHAVLLDIGRVNSWG